MSHGRFILFLLIGLILLCPPSLSSAQSVEIVFVVNIQNEADSVSIKELSEFYFKKKRHWPNGKIVRFIDRNPGSPERKHFLKYVLNKQETETDLYWIGQKLYTGNSAPIQVDTDSLAIQMVRAFDGAITFLKKTDAPQLKSRGVKMIRVEK
jgi:ABC-type phosphate transport system substrate-binding protein